MLNEKWNVSEGEKDGKQRKSTGVAEDGGRMLIRTEMAMIKSKVWSPLKGDVGEANMLIQYLYQKIQEYIAAQKSIQNDSALPISEPIPLPATATPQQVHGTVYLILAKQHQKRHLAITSVTLNKKCLLSKCQNTLQWWKTRENCFLFWMMS